MRWVLAALLAVPLAAGALDVRQDVAVTTTSQSAFAPLGAADVGVAAIGDDAASASVSVPALLLALSDDVLVIHSTDASWQVHAELTAFTGFAGLPLLPATLVLSLSDDAATQQQIRIQNGAASQSTGTPVGLPTTQPTQLRAQATSTAVGTVELELVFTRPAGGPVLRSPVTLVLS